MSNNTESLPQDVFRNFRCFRQANGLLIVPREFIKVSTGFDIDYETPPLLSCLPHERHLQHQRALLEFAASVYETDRIPKYLYFQEWSKIFKENTDKFKKFSFIHYGLTFRERGRWGSKEPLPTIRHAPIAEIICQEFYTRLPNSSFPTQR